MKELAQLLETLVSNAPCWTEMRYHRRYSQSLGVQKGIVKQAKADTTAGVGIRVLVDGAWGFSSTSDLRPQALEKALKQAFICAQSLSQLKTCKVDKLPLVPLARGHFELEGYEALTTMSLEQKLHAIIKAEELTRKSSTTISTATCAYNEMFEDKIVVTSDGASATSRLARNEFRLSAVAEKNHQMAQGHQSMGTTGAWECLFQAQSLEECSDKAAQLACDLVDAPRVEGGLCHLILSPGMVGLLSHEAIGHTVEADFVQSGSVAKGKLGQQVASELVTLCDGGQVDGTPHGGGDLLVDDEGVATKKTVIIDKGKLNSYLHNRESAAHFGVQPTGNARAWLFHNEPLIRMRNTYIEPGHTKLSEMILNTQDGYLVEGPVGGQADATGEFMFGAQRVTRIKNGKLGQLHRGATISGQAFEVLSTVDAVSEEFSLDLGSGYCGKGQPAKVDAGGPYLRCKATLGGVQK